MKTYFIKTPYWIRKLYSNLIWSFSTSKKEIYLTFDDGPTPEITAWTLNTLNNYNAKATFFCIGKNVVNYPGIHEKIKQEGHTIGNHTHNHLNGWKTSTSEYLKNVSQAEEILAKQNTHQQPTTKLFRPPYGKIKRKQAKLLIENGFKIIMWDVLSADFDEAITKKRCLQNVLENTQRGSIVIFHDSLKAEKNLKFVLPKALEYFSKRGYVFKAIKY